MLNSEVGADRNRVKVAHFLGEKGAVTTPVTTFSGFVTTLSPPFLERVGTAQPFIHAGFSQVSPLSPLLEKYSLCSLQNISHLCFDVGATPGVLTYLSHSLSLRVIVKQTYFWQW